MQQEKNYMPIHDEDHDRIIKGQTDGLSLEMAIYNAGYQRGKAQHTSGREWVKNALQWAKEAIECASQHLECPQPWVETWGNHYMNAMAAIQQAQCEIEPNGEVARKAQEAFLPGQTDESPSKEGNKEREARQSTGDMFTFIQWCFNEHPGMITKEHDEWYLSDTTFPELYEQFKNRNNVND